MKRLGNQQLSDLYGIIGEPDLHLYYQRSLERRSRGAANQ